MKEKDGERGRAEIPYIVQSQFCATARGAVLKLSNVSRGSK